MWHEAPCDIREQELGQCGLPSSFCHSLPRDHDEDTDQGNQTVSALIVLPSVESQTRGRQRPRTTVSQSSVAQIRLNIFKLMLGVCFSRTSSVLMFIMTV